jgi:hypothetical protein
MDFIQIIGRLAAIVLLLFSGLALIGVFRSDNIEAAVILLGIVAGSVLAASVGYAVLVLADTAAIIAQTLKRIEDQQRKAASGPTSRG